MEQILLSRSERGIVVFRVWPGLPYAVRVVVAFALVSGGLLWQIAAGFLWPGIVIVFAGNFLLLVRGYNNNVDFGSFKPSMEWRPATIEKIREIQKLDLKMRSWDRSALDVSNRIGGTIFVLFVLMFAASLVVGLLNDSPATVLIAANAAVLLLPHWITGTRSILTRPKLMLKIDALLKLHDGVRDEIAGDTMQFSLLMERRGDREIPEDIRFRYVPQGAAAGFLGLQGQMAVNEVQGTSYLYFYVVAVAERGYGLAKMIGNWPTPNALVLECSDNGQVEVAVLRQKTTKNSGYSTDAAQVWSIYHYGLHLAKRVALPDPCP